MLASVPGRRLSRTARAVRAGPAAIAAAVVGALAPILWGALTGRRDRKLRFAVAAIVTEGACVTANHGDCPLGPLQARSGDPPPLFELALSPTAARRAVPALGLITGAGLVLLALRSTRQAARRAA